MSGFKEPCIDRNQSQYLKASVRRHERGHKTICVQTYDRLGPRPRFETLHKTPFRNFDLVLCLEFLDMTVKLRHMYMRLIAGHNNFRVKPNIKFRSKESTP
jgi:hypothetical protein